jgi:predicted pyridoxine 5'-phosphate oxidase superfamily flavin-nucleotide-binding protein
VSVGLSEEERKRIEEAIRQGKIVVIVYESDAIKAFDLNPKDRVVIIVRKGTR